MPRGKGSQQLAPPIVVRFRDSLFGLGDAGSLPAIVGSLPTKISQKGFG